MNEQDLPFIELTILVTGASGQLGQELTQLKNKPLTIVGMGKAELDITNAEQCQRIIGSLQPDVVIHAGAYTAVDRAESEPDTAWKVNVEGTRHVARAAELVGAKFCYISTDYVFDGMGHEPYGEFDQTHPRTVYGRTKLEGEQVASANSSKVFIVRTSWVYGKYGNNFLRTMLELAKNKQELLIVNDQIGAPTYSADLVHFLLELVQTHKYGTYHASNDGECTWFEFARAIFEEAGMDGIIIYPCTTDQFPRSAPRPAYSVLGNNELIRAGFKPLRHWRQALVDLFSN